MSRNKKLQSKRKKALERNQRQAERRRNRPHTCGDCRACCYVFPLPGKPARSWCKHSTPNGCGCYDDRPALCSEYQCEYLSDNKCPPKWRPDRSGVVISLRGRFRNYPVFVLSQVWKGAIANTQIGKEILATFRANNVIFFYTTDDDGVAACYSHTDLVLDDLGRDELNAYILGDTEQCAVEQAKETFEFYGAGVPSMAG